MLKVISPRKRLDLDLWILIKYSFFTFKPWGFTSALTTVNFLFGEEGRLTIPCFSVRSSFDALLKALALPPGSEIMVSAISIQDMRTIVESHGLIPVPVDIYPDSLAADLADAKNKLTPRTKAFLFAHLFGAISNLTPLASFCEKNKLLLIEDGAQIFCGKEYLAHPKSDFTMISFGPLKTGTALAGAIISILDEHKDVADQLTKIQSSWPKHKRVDYFKRVLKFSAQHLFSSPVLFTLFVYICRIFKRDHDTIISRLTRSFPKDVLLKSIRQQINLPILSAMAWRLSKYPLWSVEEREKNAMKKVALLDAEYKIPGRKSVRHTFWLLPIMSIAPDEDIKILRENNVDATKLTTSLSCLSDNPAVETPMANELMEKTYYIPNENNSNYAIEKILRKNLQPGKNGANSVTHREEYSGLFKSYPIDYYKPKTKKAFVDVAQKIIKKGSGFSISGNSKSHGGHTVLNGEPHIDSLGLNKILKLDLKKETVHLEAGVLWRDVLRCLSPKGYSPLTMQSSNDFSIGGSIAGGIHGRNIGAPHISDAVLEIEYLDSKTGEIVTTKRGEPGFKNIVGGQGWCGIILSALIKIVPNFIFKTKVTKIETAKIPSLIEVLRNKEREIFFMSRPMVTPNYNFKKSIIYIWEQTGTGKIERSILDDRERNVLRDLLIFRGSLFAQSLVYLRNWAEYILGLLMNSKSFPRNSLLCPPVTPLEFLKQNSVKKREHTQEFFIPISKFNTFIKILPPITKKYKVRVAGITIRYIKRNEDISLSPSGEGDTISVMYYLQTKNTFGAMSKTSAFIREATRETVALGGKPFLSYAFWQDMKDIMRAYPKIKSLQNKSHLSSRFLIKLQSSI